MRLKQVFIENFRQYRVGTRIDIEEFTAFVGRNDAGKSSILEALEIFFNSGSVKLERADVSSGSSSLIIKIGCTFTDLPNKPIILDDSSTTTLKNEYLLNSDGDLEILKSFDCEAKMKESVCAVALHPTNERANDLLQLKNQELKKRISELELRSDAIDLRSNPSIRLGIWNSITALTLSRVEVPLEKADSKTLRDNIEKWMPLYALFRADRPSTDDDSEVQDPMKLAVQQALKSNQTLLDNIKQQVRKAATEVAEKTVEKLKEIAPDLASQLAPTFKAEPKWEQIFKMSLTGENDIPVNKRGSGARRLILLSFFRAAAEAKRTLQNSPSLVYAIEEPETSQHPSQQRMLVEALRELAGEDCQVLVTTHNPALAGLVPTKGIRYVRVLDRNTIVERGDNILSTVASELGVLADHRIKVLVCVEGPNDFNFFNHVSRVFYARNPSLPCLVENPKIAFVHMGGSNLIQWVNNHYLKELRRPEVHLYDRGTDQPPTFQKSVETMCARGDGSYATLTRKRELENYLHPDAIKEALNVEVQFGDEQGVPEIVAEAIHNASPDHGGSWAELAEKKKEKKVRQAKVRLNDDAAKKMTYDRLKARDPGGELEDWLSRIGKLCE